MIRTTTGNRTAFQERIEELEGRKREASGIAIMMFDVNDLKYVNDHLGHQPPPPALHFSLSVYIIFL